MWPFSRRPNLLQLVEDWVQPDGKPSLNAYVCLGTDDTRWFTMQYRLLRLAGWRLVRANKPEDSLTPTTNRSSGYARHG